MKNLDSSSPEVTLGPLREANLEKYLAWRNDPKIYTWCRQYEPLTEAQHLTWFRSLDGNTKVKMYELRFQGNAVGVCGFTSLDYINRNAEFSLYIASEFHGQGLGALGLAALLDHGFDWLGLNYIWGETFDGNPAMDIFLRLGFSRDGVRRKFYFRNGDYLDAHLVGILRGEWHERRTDFKLHSNRLALCVPDCVDMDAAPKITRPADSRNKKRST